MMILGCNTDMHNNKPLESEKSNIDKFINIVIADNRSNHKYFFSKDTTNYLLEYEISYLGEAKMQTNKVLKFVYLDTYSGSSQDSKHCNSKLFIYNSIYRLGFYDLGSNSGIIAILSNNNIIFSYKKNYSDCKSITCVDFTDSIPKNIFIKCNETDNKIFGDCYSFNPDYKYTK